MTLNEFRAWFDGFSEALDGAPTAEQWAKVRAKLAETKDPIAGMFPNAQRGHISGAILGQQVGVNLNPQNIVSGVAAPARN
ncbi:hypothetical protein CNY89_17465 [Amaricoccus sp. HAR-UPW-R2A-40]|nr:hypothetical protein CNY89_17465 [Amaricoccus sp. HAR-UPW-R2A-40]